MNILLTILTMLLWGISGYFIIRIIRIICTHKETKEIVAEHEKLKKEIGDQLFNMTDKSNPQ